MGFDFKEIPTARLVLRSLCPSDADTFLRYRSKPEVAEFQSWKPKVKREILRFIAQQKRVEPGTPNAWMQLAVCLKETGEMIGDCGVHFLPPDARQVEIGFTIEPGRQGRGYGTEAVRALLDYAFRELHAHRICASVDPANAPSIALLTRVGMRKEAHFRKSLMIDGKWVDDIVFAVLEEEWE
jgi:RimJ/RimL family protein N-acetyltransferase